MKPNVSSKIFNIVLGLKCNFNCNHCISSSNVERNERLGQSDLVAISEAVKKLGSEYILFTGGEPTIYKSEMRNAIDLIRYNNFDGDFGITSNGSFATSQKQVNLFLNEFPELKLIQISIDAAHFNNTTIRNLEFLIEAIKGREINIVCLAAIKEPLEILEMSKIQSQLGMPFLFQKAIKGGRAKNTGHYYKYRNSNLKISELYCPTINSISYVPNKGFSQCCSNLVYDDIGRGHYDKSLENYLNSKSYNLINKYSLYEISKKLNIEIDENNPDFNDSCSLCESIFKSYDLKLKE